MNIVCLTGAGISRESGLKTFRDEDGLWAGHRIEDVCTADALHRDPKGVLEFYNMRRREVLAAEPNPAHLALAAKSDIQIITQNIDDLHERAGSQFVLHLHGEVFKARSMKRFDVQVEAKGDFTMGDLAPDGEQLRPHICLFQETPYDWELAAHLAEEADIFLVIGTSLAVYPAAHLIEMPRRARIVLIDPNPPAFALRDPKIEVIAEKASVGVPSFIASIG